MSFSKNKLVSNLVVVLSYQWCNEQIMMASHACKNGSWDGY